MKTYYLVNFLKEDMYEIIDKSRSKEFIKHKQLWWKRFLGVEYKIIVMRK
jgi:hypothetical protein